MPKESEGRLLLSFFVRQNGRGRRSNEYQRIREKRKDRTKRSFFCIKIIQDIGVMKDEIVRNFHTEKIWLRKIGNNEIRFMRVYEKSRNARRGR